MKCITFGYLVVLLILLIFVSLFVPSTVTSVIGAGLVLWWFAGFIAHCDSYAGK